MQKFLSALGRGLVTAVCILILLLVLPWLLLYTPVDYIRYRRSNFFRDTGAKYIWLAGMPDTVQTYEAIKKSGLPIEYCGQDFFVCGETLLCDMQLEFDGEWTVYTGEEDDTASVTSAVDQAIAQCRALNPERTISRAVILWMDAGEPLPVPLPSGPSFRVLTHNEGTSKEEILRQFAAECEVSCYETS